MCDIQDKNDKKLISIVSLKEKKLVIENYAILSYVWGDFNSANFLTVSLDYEDGKIDKKLSPGGMKSLDKSLEVCRYLGINYL